MTDLISNLQWRYATKKMNPAKSVPENKVARIVEAVRLSPSANGLQPYQVIVAELEAGCKHFTRSAFAIYLIAI